MRGCILILASAAAHEPPGRRETLRAYLGETPRIDGALSPAEWSDAFAFSSAEDWVAEFSPARNASDLSMRGWAKHDATHLYFAFDVVDDVAYAVDTPRWLPGGNPNATELTQRGWPWFGDEMESAPNARGLEPRRPLNRAPRAAPLPAR